MSESINGKRRSPVYEIRFETTKCVKCDSDFTFVMRNVKRKYCDDCAVKVRLAQRRARQNKLKRDRRAASDKQNGLIRYAGYDGSAARQPRRRLDDGNET